MSTDFRVERDSMGEMRVPSGVLYEPQTQRAVQNFPISRLRFPRSFIHALGLIKAAAAKANAELGEITPEIAAKIESAATRVINGELDSDFVLDIFQTGSGTSTNMNANEVIGKLAGAHPNDQVNRGQSSNDAIPAAIHIAAAQSAHASLLPAMDRLHRSLSAKADAFHGVLKIGRTHLQDAVPMRLGQEFSGYARQVESSAERIRAALAGIYELPLGGTAVGTGINTPRQFAPKVVAEIARRTSIPFVEARNHFEAQAAKDAVSFFSGALRTYAIAVTKICNDIRWLGSGPRCGLGELKLPEVQPGSSIMPGKVNPVIAESALMVCAQVIGNDAAIAWSCAAGNFELNVMMPVIARNLLESEELLATTSLNLAERLIDGLEPDLERIAALVEGSLSTATGLAPEIGYDQTAAIVKEAYKTRRSVREVAKQKSNLSDDKLNAALDPLRQAGE